MHLVKCRTVVTFGASSRNAEHRFLVPRLLDSSLLTSLLEGSVLVLAILCLNLEALRGPGMLSRLAWSWSAVRCQTSGSADLGMLLACSGHALGMLWVVLTLRLRWKLAQLPSLQSHTHTSVDRSAGRSPRNQARAQGAFKSLQALGTGLPQTASWSCHTSPCDFFG